MFLIIPLSLIALAFMTISVIVWQKMPYLKKLTPESHEVGETFWHDMYPEIVDWIRHVPINQYKENFLREMEKALRRIRLMFSKIDRLSDGLIRSVRRQHIESANETQTESEMPATLDTKIPDVLNVHVRPQPAELSAEELRQREQELIISIARNPKDVDLYERLGDVYVHMKAFEDARESYKAGLKLDPERDSLKKKLEAAQK